MNDGHNANRGFSSDKAQNIAPERRESAADRRPRVADAGSVQQAEERRRRALAIRRRRKEAFTARLTLLVAVYAAGCLIIGGFVFSLYRKSGSAERHILVVEDSGGGALCRLSAGEVGTDGAEYISASALSKLYSFTLAGDKEQVNMYFFNAVPAEAAPELFGSEDSAEELQDVSRDESGMGKPPVGSMTYDNIRLFKNSAVLEMNGENVRLGSKIIFTDDYYIPLELIENYFFGAIIEREDGVITLSRNESARFTLRLHDPRL